MILWLAATTNPTLGNTEVAKTTPAQVMLCHIKNGGEGGEHVGSTPDLRGTDYLRPSAQRSETPLPPLFNNLDIHTEKINPCD